MSSWLSSIEGIVIAASAFVSAVILWLTFRSVNAQTEISRKQFEMAMRRQEEPDLTVLPGNFAPFSRDDGNGYLTVTVHNCGAIPLRALKVTVVVAGTNTLLLGHGPFSISPGESADVRGTFFISPQLSPVAAEIICDFETSNGRKFQKRDSWHLYHSKEHHPLSSSPVEEILKS